MSGDLGDRTEAPTNRRRKEARDAGRLVVSFDLALAIRLLVSAGLLAFVGGGLCVHLAILLKSHLTQASQWNPEANGSAAGVQRQLLSELHPLGIGLLILFAGAVMAVVVTHMLQTRGWFRVSQIAPRISRLNLLGGVSRVFGLRGGGRAIGAVMKLIVLMTACYVSVASPVDQLVGAPIGDSPEEASRTSLKLSYWLGRNSLRVLMSSGVVMAFWGLGDYAWKRWRFERELRMTPEELRQEQRENAPHPALRRQLQTRRAQLQNGTDIRPIPSEIQLVGMASQTAVIVEFDPHVMSAPRIRFIDHRKRDFAKTPEQRIGHPILLTLEAPDLIDAIREHSNSEASLAPRLFAKLVKRLREASERDSRFQSVLQTWAGWERPNP